MTTRKRAPLLAAAAICAVAACGDDGAKNLKAVFYRTMPTAPVATFTVQGQNGAALQGASVIFDTRAVFDRWQNVGYPRQATVQASGAASIALAAGTYPIRIETAGGRVGALNDTLTISQDMVRTYRTSQQTWTVTSPKALSELSIGVYQVDSDGKAIVPPAGSAGTLQEALVLNDVVSVGNATQATFSTELFKGSYRAIIRGTPVAAADTIAPFETPVFAAAGGGAVEPQTVALSSGGNIISLRFMQAGAPVPDVAIGSVVVHDAGSLLWIGSAKPTGGVATVSTGAVANVKVLVLDPDGRTLAAGAFTASPTHSETLTRYTVSGRAKAASGAPLTPDANNSYGRVAATLKTSLGSPWDEALPASAPLEPITDALGTYQLKLFSGTWSLKAMPAKDLPSSTPLTVSVSADLPSQDLPLTQGGIIAGNVQDEARNNLPDVQIDVYDASHAWIAGTRTDLTGNFSVPVPFGTWSVIAGSEFAPYPYPKTTARAQLYPIGSRAGALTKNVAVSSGTPTRTLNLTRFEVRGRLTDKASAPVSGLIYSSAGTTNTDNLGIYTLKVMEGLNWFFFEPVNAPALGSAYEMDVLVNAEAMKSLQ